MDKLLALKMFVETVDTKEGSSSAKFIRCNILGNPHWGWHAAAELGEQVVALFSLWQLFGDKLSSGKPQCHVLIRTVTG